VVERKSIIIPVVPIYSFCSPRPAYGKSRVLAMNSLRHTFHELINFFKDFSVL
jgi:hypothetical protein